MLSREIYEALPYAYVGTGTLVLLGLESEMRVVPGAALICAGLLAFFLRITARSRVRRVERIGRQVRALRARHGLPESPRSALPARTAGRNTHPKRTAHV